MIIRHKETLTYYDGILLFIGETPCRAKMLCVQVDCNTEFDTYLCVPVASQRLKALLGGEIDLLSVYQEPENKCYIANINDWKRCIQLKGIEYSEIPEDWFPGENSYM